MHFGIEFIILSLALYEIIVITLYVTTHGNVNRAM